MLGCCCCVLGGRQHCAGDLARLLCLSCGVISCRALAALPLLALGAGTLQSKQIVTNSQKHCRRLAGFILLFNIRVITKPKR